MAKRRIDFSSTTIEIIAKRAAYRCCYPDCDRLLIGPGSAPDDVVNLGQCAHIYSAAEDGPRGRAQLSEDALRSPENGIFLCHKHHKLVDSKGGENKYPASVLLYYKALHDQKISQEIGSLKFPMLWIKSIEIIKAPFLQSGSVFTFARANVICGGNGSGKSLIIEFLYCVITGQCIRRFKNKEIEILIYLSNPVFSSIHCTIANNKVFYRMNGKSLSFSPFAIDVVFLHEYEGRYGRKGDDIDYFCRSTNLTREQVKSLIQTTDMSNGSIADKLELKTVREKPYEKVNVMLRRCDDRGKKSDHMWNFYQLSQTEKSRIMVELLLNHIECVSQYRPITFLIDSSEFYVYDKETHLKYLDILQTNSTNFQTVMASLSSGQNLALEFPGWNMIPLYSYSKA